MSNTLHASPCLQRQPLRISTDVSLFPPSHSSSDSFPVNNTISPTSNIGSSQCFLHVTCMHDFYSSDPAHLSFYKDEALIIVKQEHTGWWAAMRPEGDRIGWIPSSFVVPSDRGKAMEYPGETQWGGLDGSPNDSPLSAVDDPWVRVSEDHKAPSFQLVTPTDLVWKGFYDDGLQDNGYELIFNLSNDERSYDLGCVCPFSTETSPSHRAQLLHLSPCSLLAEPRVLQLSRSASPRMFDGLLDDDDSPTYGADERMPFLRLTIPISPDETVPELISSLDFEESLVDFGSFVTSRENPDSDDDIDEQSQPVTSGVCLTGPDQGIPDGDRLLNFAWSPDNLAEQLCVLMHTQYASIRQNDCFDWMKGRRNTGMTGLRYFFDTHDQIASWVQQSVLAYDDATQQAEALDIWIKVAERCQALRNFDSLGAIILVLSGPSVSSLCSAWLRCSQKHTFERLHSALDVASKFRRIIDVMDAAKGPSVPFVRKHLENIKGLRAEHRSNPPCQPGHTFDMGPLALRKLQLAAVATLLRHQTSSYRFKASTLHDFICSQLRAVRLITWWLPVGSEDMR